MSESQQKMTKLQETVVDPGKFSQIPKKDKLYRELYTKYAVDFIACLRAIYVLYSLYPSIVTTSVQKDHTPRTRH